MIKLTSFQTTTFLPNPEFGDSEGILDEVTVKRTIIGGRHVYVKTKGSRRRLTLNFRLTRLKALELRAFIRSYFSSTVTLVDHLDQVWVGNFMSNPFEFTSVTGPDQTIQLDFEGVKQ